MMLVRISDSSESRLMKAYETTATVESTGQVRVSGVPFQPGTEVDVIVAAKRASVEEFAGAWEKLCREFRNTPHVNNITEEDVQEEMNDYRAGR